MDTSEYAELFQAEANEYMQILNQCLLSLERQPSDRENLLEAFRVVHSLKGMAGTMGYRQVTDIAHGLENFLEDLKAGRLEVTAAVLDLVFEAVDCLQTALANPEEPLPHDGKKIEKLLEKIKSFQQSAQAAGAEAAAEPAAPLEFASVEKFMGEMEREMVRQALERGENPYLFKISLRQGTVMQSVRSYMVLRAMEEQGEVILTVPPQQDLEDDKFDREFMVGIILSEAAKAELLKKELLKITDVEQVTFSPWLEAMGAASAATKGASAGETGQEEQAAHAERTAEKMVRVETQKLDELVNLVGELVVTRTRIGEIGRGYSEELDDSIDKLNRTIANLQDTAMALRMVPIKQVFDRFPRMVRDLSREMKKEVRLEISGESTELDRSIVNRLSDPLVHLLRNAVDHGIEEAAVREAAGKDPVGTVQLKARHEGNQVVITVEDDGAGIDPSLVVQRALEVGLITAEEAARLKGEEVYSLIFQNGFSTSRQITEISGRGVGMDAVKKCIEALHGTIVVQSEPGRFTRFVLRLPLTLAIIKALMVRSGGRIYAVPIELVRENTYIEPTAIKTIQGSLVVNLRNEVIPLYYLSDLLGFGGAETVPEEYAVVIADTGARVAGLIVDELVGQQEVMIKSIGKLFEGVKGIAGATILGDGTVSLIIDVAGLLENGRDKHA